MSKIKEEEIISLLSKPETFNQGFEILVKTYSKQLYFHIRRMLIIHQDADDVLQETWIKAFTQISKFRFESSIYTWLYRIATNNCLNFLDKKKRQFVFSALNYEDSLVQKLESDKYFDGDDLQLKLQKAVLKLPEKQRLVFNMKYYGEMKYDEISEILGTSVGALKASYHHATTKIEKYINED
ncbi:MAG: RNA polymerase sigma factor [Bacteroidales bacterium]|jgi:RNA polymerase sigma-70 factor (ECF subfamily)|nr:RNA polymerase sigma factor [Bacteroidales bacterium]MCK9499704.1 RNA polymerase sigma factor [Bacteroidales bacterium]MDY0314641.1 RNA polymerase sigma factor [Bacteroidales bacterium]NLB86451.1 RNA polymerase sigma factor [Bacteroidales bacterium]